MAKMATHLTVEMHDGATFNVVVDQRDWAQWEATGLDAGRFTRPRHFAFTAAVRAKAYAGSWDEWNTRDCVEVNVAEGQEDEAEADPTRPASTPGRKTSRARG